jgi:septum formation protein
MRTLVLASQSPRRHEILSRAGFLFHTLSVEISEILNENLSLNEALMDLARRKAEALLRSGKLAKDEPYLILSADTEVILGSRVLGKPKTLSENEEYLRLLSGQMHFVKTAVCFFDTTSMKVVTAIDTTEIEFSKVSQDEIHTYVQSKKPLDKAGGYGIQEIPNNFVASMKGSLENVIGLPIVLVERVLRENGWQIPRRSP